MLQSGMSQSQAQLDEFKASALIFQSKYYKANVWDVFRSPAEPNAGNQWNLYNFSMPYDAKTRTRINWGTGNNRYLAFDLVLSDLGHYEDDLFGSMNRYNIIIKLYEADGRYVKDICDYGVLMGFGDKGFLFNQNNYYGTFFTNEAHTSASSLSYTPTTGRITKLSEIKSYSYSPQLFKPSAAITTFEHNGELQQVAIATNSAYTISGTVSAIDVGNYTVTVTLNDKTNTSWVDGTTDDVTIDWSITKGIYDMGNADWDYSEPFTWDGTQKTVSVTGLPSGVTVDGYTGNTATSVGTYNAIVSLAYDQNNYNAPVMPELSWSIKHLEVAKPIVNAGNFTYNGNAQSIDIPSNNFYSVTGTLSAVNVGNYTATISLKDKNGSAWADGTTDDVTIDWSITKGTYDMTNSGWDYSEPFTWDGTQKIVSVTGLPSGVTVDGYTGNTATSVGTYNAIVSLAYDQNNYNAPVMPELSWSIKHLEVAKPIVNAGSFTYNGEVQELDISLSNHYSVSGVVSSKNAGDFSARVSLNNKEACFWSDGTNDDIIILWSISKASYNMNGAEWNYSELFIWDGTPKTVLVTGLPSGVSVQSYFENSATHVGTYTATTLLNYDELNYHEPIIAPLVWEIKPGYTNLNIIKLWDNVLAVSNGNKYEDIRNASYNWYRNGILLQGNQQYISFEGAIPAGSYKVEIIIDNHVALSLDYVVQSGAVAIAYPNPVQTGRSLVVEMGEERPAGEQAEVLNSSGYPVKASVERQATGYRISGISTPGTYFVRVFKTGQTITTLKIIVN